VSARSPAALQLVVAIRVTVFSLSDAAAAAAAGHDDDDDDDSGD